MCAHVQHRYELAKYTCLVYIQASAAVKQDDVTWIEANTTYTCNSGSRMIKEKKGKPKTLCAG